MPNSFAEAYMLVLRPVPIVGEAVAPPFNGQIYIDEWSWNLTPATSQHGTSPQSAATSGSGEGEATFQNRDGDPPTERRPQLRSSDLPRFDASALIDDVTRIQRNRNFTQQQRDRRVLDLIQRAGAAHQAQLTAAGARADAAAEDESGSGRTSRSGASEEGKEKLTFSFTKTTDFATTQMLYSMANNDLIPTIILTVFQRSMRVPVTLIITMGNVRFVSCSIKGDGTQENMSEMVENWTAEYESIDYAYQNRPPIGLKTSVFNAATQGRVKIFAMKPRGGSGGLL